MAIEIERKFLVSGDFRPYVASSSRIAQGYLSRERGRTVRLRLRDDKAYITIKGPSGLPGIGKYEFEQEIPYEDGRKILTLCDKHVIEKIRHIVPIGRHVCEVDEFLGANQGLVVAEIELAHENEPYERPPFLGREVTGQAKYYNAMLSIKPYREWDK